MVPAGHVGIWGLTSRCKPGEFPMCLVQGGVWEGREELWDNVLLDWAWGILNGPGSWACREVRSQVNTGARSFGP